MANYTLGTRLVHRQHHVVATITSMTINFPTLVFGSVRIKDDTIVNIYKLDCFNTPFTEQQLDQDFILESTFKLMSYNKIWQDING